MQSAGQSGDFCLVEYVDSNPSMVNRNLYSQDNWSRSAYSNWLPAESVNQLPLTGSCYWVRQPVFILGFEHEGRVCVCVCGV